MPPAVHCVGRRMTSSRASRVLVALTLAAISFLLASALQATSVGRRLEAISYDARLAREAAPASASAPIVLVEINESSLRQLQPVFGRWPWPRAAHSGVIDFLTRAKARVIAYDVLLTEPDRSPSLTIGGTATTGAASDQLLIDSVRQAGNVVMLADATFEGLASGQTRTMAPFLPGTTYAPGPGFQPRVQLQPPFGDLTNAAAALGHNVAVHDADAVVRRALPFIDVDGTAVPSLGMAAALLAEHTPADRVKLGDGVLSVGAHALPLLDEPTPSGQPSRQTLLDFRAATHAADGSASVYPVYSFFDVLLSDDRLSSGQTPPIDPSVFTDKIVFVGTTAAGLSDVYSTPLGAAPGMLLHATLTDNLIDGPVMRRASPRVDLALTIGVAISVALVATYVPVVWAIGLVVVLSGLLVSLLTREIGAGVWVGAVGPLAAAAVALFGGVAWQYVVEGRAKRHVKQLFGRYVSKDVIDQLMSDPSLVRLGGTRRDMTVLFSDIRGFTTASEQGTPEGVVAQLNEYFGVMVDVLFRHQGTLDKFVGDMVMGLFGAPLEDPLHADHAVATAIEMMAELDKLNAKWRASGMPAVDIGIGINSGEMIAGNIGSSAIMSYTVIGDAVNLGSRLESLNKEHGTHILISQGTLDRLTKPVETRRIGDVTVKGRKAPVTVYEVIAPRGH